MNAGFISRLNGNVFLRSNAKDAQIRLNRFCSSLSWKKVRRQLVEGLRSLVAFTCGLLLASLYGLMALLVQKQPLWQSAYTTVGVAFLAAFGLGLCSGVRDDVLVLLPSLCSAHGRKLLLFLFATALLSGPVTNTLENAERAAASLLCGAELAANQTQELMQRAATPLYSALDRIRDISRNAKSAAGRIRHFMDALLDTTRHIARTLRNVLHFLVDIGDVCNDKLGAPHRKCYALFTKAHADCATLLVDFDFLCDIIMAFQPLCSLARAGELFCVVPSYIAHHLRKRLAAPAVAAFERMKQEFDFDLSASVIFDLNVNSSRSLQQMYQGIVEDLADELHFAHRLTQPLGYFGLLMLAFAFFKASRYRRRYLQEIDFDNIYITDQFKELDQKEASTVSWHQTAQEQKAAVRGVASVLRHLLTGGMIVGLDFLVFWMLDQVRHLVEKDVVARAPVAVEVQVGGTGYLSDIFKDLVATFDLLQGGNITIISKKCLLQPSHLDHGSYFILGLLGGLSLLVAVGGGFMQRCRRLVCALLYPDREHERIQFLRQQILDQRRIERRAMRRSCARRPRRDQRPPPSPPSAQLSHPPKENWDVPPWAGVYCHRCPSSVIKACHTCFQSLTRQQVSSDEDTPPQRVSTATHPVSSSSSISSDDLSSQSETEASEGHRPDLNRATLDIDHDSTSSITSPKTSGVQNLHTVQVHPAGSPQDLQEFLGHNRTSRAQPW